jgi:hypothetical protein
MPISVGFQPRWGAASISISILLVTNWTTLCARAQPLPEPVPVTPPAAAPISPAPRARACEPACDPARTCVEGSCVRLCIPACGAGYGCNDQGACEQIRIELADPGVHRHDGFFLRINFGVGYGVAQLKGSAIPDEVYSGPGFGSSIDLGSALAENLILHARLRDASIAWPSVTFDDEEPSGVSAVLVSQVMAAVGLQYYFMPINVFVGLSVGIAGMETVLERSGKDDVRNNARAGVGIDLDVGKEWWVSESWAIGVAGRLSLVRVSAEAVVDEDADFRGGFLAVLGTATYQ